VDHLQEERDDVFASSSQRREHDGQAVEAREQVGAEAASGDGVQERLLRGAHDPRVDRNGV
jgi:hypothetical protein